MRTPGSDPELVAGLLLRRRADRLRAPIWRHRALRQAGRRRLRQRDRRLRRARLRLRSGCTRTARRDLPTSSACGGCGRVTIDDLLARAQPDRRRDPLRSSWLGHLPARLRAEQANFERTGGLHAAAVSDREDHLAHVREDVRTTQRRRQDHRPSPARRRLPLSGRLLVVSGRTSFEIIKKAVCARPLRRWSASPPRARSRSRPPSASTCSWSVSPVAGTYNVYSGAHRTRPDTETCASSSAPPVLDSDGRRKS